MWAKPQDIIYKCTLRELEPFQRSAMASPVGQVPSWIWRQQTEWGVLYFVPQSSRKRNTLDNNLFFNNVKHLLRHLRHPVQSTAAHIQYKAWCELQSTCVQIQNIDNIDRIYRSWEACCEQSLNICNSSKWTWCHSGQSDYSYYLNILALSQHCAEENKGRERQTAVATVQHWQSPRRRFKWKEMIKFNLIHWFTAEGKTQKTMASHCMNQ